MYPSLRVGRMHRAQGGASPEAENRTSGNTVGGAICRWVYRCVYVYIYVYIEARKLEREREYD